MNNSYDEICDRYFKEHPEDKEGVIRAHYAYHAHRNEDDRAHNFPNCRSWESICLWCGRTVFDVRYGTDDLLPYCLVRPYLPTIVDVIKEEELKYWVLVNRAKTEVPKLIKKHGITGESLSLFHHTYGYDPEIVSSIVDLPDAVINDYYREFEKERELSRASMVKKVITAQ